MDTLIEKAFAFVTAILLLAGASLTTLVMPAAKAWAAEPAMPAPSDQNMPRMMPPQQGGMPGMGPGTMTGRPGTMGSAMGPGMGGGAMCPMCAGAGMVGGMVGSTMDALGLLNLTNEQRNKIEELQDDLRKKNWDTYGKILDEQVKLRKLSQADPLDPKKIGAAYASVGKLQQQLAEMQAEHWNGMMAVLTQEQKERLKRWQGGEPGMGMMSPSGVMAR